MGRVFLCYKPLHPPTGVEHCCFAHFTHPEELNLVVAHANVLEIYVLHTLANGEVVSEIVASYTLAGRVEALNVLPLHRKDLPDVLLVTTRPAKAVLVAFEREAAELVVLDLYSFEHDALGLGSAVRADPPNVDRLEGLGDKAPTVMDPNARCAGMLVYGTQIAMMPFKKEVLGKKVMRLLLGSRPDQVARRKELFPTRIHPRQTFATALMSAAMHRRAQKRKRKRDGGGGGGGGGGGEGDGGGAAGGEGFERDNSIRQPPVAGEGEGHLDLGDQVEKKAASKSAAAAKDAAENGGGEEEEDEEDDDDAFYDDEDDDEHNDEAAAAEFETELGGEKPYILKLREQLQVRGLIKDMCFLGGFMQPTLAILHIEPPGWGGTVAARAHCGHLSVISCGAGKATTLFQVNQLPHDSFRILAPPEPLSSGVLVVSSNALHFVQEGRVRTAAATNGFGPTTVATARHPLQKAEQTGLTQAVALDGARVGFLDGHVGLLSVGTGELLGLRLESQAGRVTALRLQKLGGGHGSGIFPTAIAVQREAAFVFLASRTVDSLLLRFALQTVDVVEQQQQLASVMGEDGGGGGGGGEGGTKGQEAAGRRGRKRGRVIKGEPGVSMDVEEEVAGGGEGEEEGEDAALQNHMNGHAGGVNGDVSHTPEEEEELALYGQVVEVETAATRLPEENVQIHLGSRVTLSILDAWPSLGPLVDATLTPQVPSDVYAQSPLLGPDRLIEGDAISSSSSSYLHTHRRPTGGAGMELLCCAGQGKKGALVVLRRGLVADILGRAALPGPCRGLWVLPSVPAEEENANANATLGGFVVASLPKQTVVYRYLGAKLEAEPQSDQLGFHVQATTLALAPVANGRGLVQIYGGPHEGAPGGAGAALRLVWDGVATQEMVLHDERDVGGAGLAADAVIVHISVQDPYLLLLLSNGTVSVLALDEEEGEFVPCEMGVYGQEHESPITAAALFRWRTNLGLGKKPKRKKKKKKKKKVEKKRGGRKATRGKKAEHGGGGGGDDVESEEEDEDDELVKAAVGFLDDDDGTGERPMLGEDEEELALYGGGGEKEKAAAEGGVGTDAAAAAVAAAAEMVVATTVDDEAADEEDLEEEEEEEGVVMCALCRANGMLEIVALQKDPQKEPVRAFLSARCAEGPRILRNGLLFHDMRFKPGRREAPAVGLEGEAQVAAAAYPTIKEMSVAVVGPASAEMAGDGVSTAAARILERLCVTMWTSEDDLLVYVARPLSGVKGAGGGGGQQLQHTQLPFSLLRLSHDLITRQPRHALPAENRPFLERRLFPFSSGAVGAATSPIDNQNGVFVGGTTPAWIVCERGCVKVMPAGLRDSYTRQPLPPQAHVAAFAPFPDAEAGFLLAHVGAEGHSCLSLATADFGGTLGYTSPTGVSTGANVTFRRLGPLGHEAKKLVALEVATSTPFYAVIMGRGEGSTAAEEADVEDGAVLETGGGVEDEEDEDEEHERKGSPSKAATTTAATMDPTLLKAGERLTDFTAPRDDYLGAPPLPGLWAGGHKIFVMGGAPFGVTSVVPLRKYERGISLLLYHRRPEGPPMPPQPSPYYNSYPPPPPLAGRYLVVGTCKVRSKGEDVPSQGRMVVYRVEVDRERDQAVLRQVDEVSQRSGPPTALAQLNNHIIMAAGPTLWVFSFVREKLRPIAFYDADFYVVSLRVVKNFISATDAYHSVHLLRWHETDPNHTLELLGKDYSQFVTAQPGGGHFVVDPPSLGVVVGDDRGNLQLLQYDQADVESRGGNRLIRRADFHLSHRLSFLEHARPGPVARMGALSPGLRILLFGTVEGGAGALVPLEEKVFRRLYALQAVMANALPHPCAFNPRGYRLFEARGFLTQERKKGMLDGELLWRYPSLDIGTQEDLASAIGTSREMILDTLLEIDMMTWVF